MRYGNPTTAPRIEALKAQGCDRILLLPLYPQYAAATTATACDEAFRALMRMRWQPAVRAAPPWHDDAAYIDALAATRSRQARRRSIFRAGGDHLRPFTACRRTICSKGDPYHCQCVKTGRLLREALQLGADSFTV